MRSFSSSGSATTALWVNQELADNGSDSISSVLKLKRVEPNDSSKTPAGRRERKNEAVSSVEVEGLGGLLPGYSSSDVQDKGSSSRCPTIPPPEIVYCQQAPNEASNEVPLKNPNEIAKKSIEYAAAPANPAKKDTTLHLHAPLKNPSELAKNSLEYVSPSIPARNDSALLQHINYADALVDHLEANAAGLLLSLSQAAS